MRNQVQIDGWLERVTKTRTLFNQTTKDMCQSIHLLPLYLESLLMMWISQFLPNPLSPSPSCGGSPGICKCCLGKNGVVNAYNTNRIPEQYCVMKANRLWWFQSPLKCADIDACRLRSSKSYILELDSGVKWLGDRFGVSPSRSWSWAENGLLRELVDKWGEVGRSSNKREEVTLESKSSSIGGREKEKIDHWSN